LSTKIQNIITISEGSCDKHSQEKIHNLNIEENINMSITVFTILHFLKEIKTFIQQGCIELITSDSKNIVILQKIYISNKSF